MPGRLAALLLCASALTAATIYDRVDASIGTHPIKESEIDRELRITAFLNGSALTFDPYAKRGAASRLADQALIRDEISKGNYPSATPKETDAALKQIRTARFRSETDYKKALNEYGITEDELKAHIAWQIAVLNFVELRFQPKLLEQKPSSVNMLRAREERVNQAFFAWLDEARRHTRIQFHGELAQ